MSVDFLSGALDSRFMMRAFAIITVFASIVSVVYPFFFERGVTRRTRLFAIERDRVRARERSRSSQESRGLRHTEKKFIKDIVERFLLKQWLNAEDARLKLVMAGYRAPQAETTFIFARLVSPFAAALLAVIYVFFLAAPTMSASVKELIAIGALYIGLKGPELYLRNVTIKRQESMRRVVPDALDLLLICVESGMSIEHAFRRVGSEISEQSIALAEEIAVTSAELSYLQDRKQAYANLGMRTGLEALRQVMAGLIQAEKYGTPLGQALRVAAREMRDARMHEAEKKGAALPPKLTIPMIVFFIPPLMVIILGPAILKIPAGIF
jgi:tight adherence protein C